jgi:hypothetical protein
MHSSITSRLVVTTSLAVLAIGAAAPAAAKPLERGSFHDVFVTDPYQLCGLTVQDTADFRGSFVIQPRQPDGLPYFSENSHSSITTTNLATDMSFTVVSNIVNKDKVVTDNGDGTLTILAMGAGGERIYGPDGKIVSRNPGQVRFEILVDHGGTPTDPSDDEFLDFLGIVKGSTGRTDEFGCEQITELIG